MTPRAAETQVLPPCQFRRPRYDTPHTQCTTLAIGTLGSRKHKERADRDLMPLGSILLKPGYGSVSVQAYAEVK